MSTTPRENFDEPRTPTDSTSRAPDERQIKRGTIDWRQVCILSMAGCGPASVIALNLQFMGQFAGSALVLAFLIVWPGILLLVNTFAEFAKHMPTAGGLYTWNARAWGKNIGFVYGWTFVGAYMVFSAAGFAVFGGWMNEWLATQFGVGVPWWVFTLLALAYVTMLGYLGITQSLHAAFTLLAIEIVILLALAIYILIAGPSEGGGFGLEPFKPGAAGWTGVALAMSFAVLSHVGIEEGATLGLEVRNPRRGIPKGLWIAAILVPIFYVVVGYAMVYGYGIDKMREFGLDPTPLQTLGSQYWGDVGLAIVVIAALSSILAFSQAAFIAGARVVYTLGRERVLPHWLSGVSKRQTPHHAVFFMGGVSMLLGFPLAAIVGPFNVWGYFGYLISTAFLVSYIITHAGMIKFMRDLGDFRWIRHGVLGVLGMAIFVFPLYQQFADPGTGAYAVLPFVYLGWLLIGVALLLYTRARRPEVLAAVGTSLAEDETLDELPRPQVEK